MPASPMIVQFFVLESRDLQLERPYALAGLGPGGTQRFELHGTLTRDLDPLDGDASGDFVARIPLPAVPIAALQLDIQNGDNVPPAFEWSTLLSRTAELVSPLPAGTYELLLERRDEAPPVYDLAPSREALLAYERRDVTFVTGFGPNTAFRPMLAQPGPGAVPPWLLWSSLIAAILVLGVITLRHSSADAEPGGPHA